MKRFFVTFLYFNLVCGWQHPRFKYYAMWSWGGPGIVSAITVLMQYLPASLTEGHTLPEIGTTSCFLGQEGAVYYMHIVNAPILLSNLFLFAFSSWSLCCGIWSTDNMASAGADTVRKV